MIIFVGKLYNLIKGMEFSGKNEYKDDVLIISLFWMKLVIICLSINSINRINIKDKIIINIVNLREIENISFDAREVT